jgi:hypothetical protein
MSKDNLFGDLRSVRGPCYSVDYSYWSFLTYLFIFIFLPIMSLLMFNLGVGSNVYYMALIKDLSVFLLISTALLWYLLTRKCSIKNQPLVWLVLFYIILIVVNAFYFSGLDSKSIVGIRKIVFLLLVFLAFSFFRLNSRQIVSVFNLYCYLGWLVIAFGLVELLSGETIWSFLSIAEYWNANPVGVEEFATIKDSGHLYTGDLLIFFTEKLRRMVSVFLEPTHFASFLLTFFGLQLIYFQRYISAFFIFIFGCLTFSKFFIISALLMYMVHLRGRCSIWLHLLMFVGIFALARFIYYEVGLTFGFLAHLVGFFTGLELLIDYPFGVGVGVGGNRGDIGWSSEAGTFGGESGMGNIFAQVGIFGILHLYIFMRASVQFDTLFRSTGNRLFLFGGALLFGYMLNFYLSASSLASNGNIFIFMMLGLIINYRPAEGGVFYQ